MVVAGISNLPELQSKLPIAKLVGVLTSVHILLESAIQQHNMYLVDCLENRLVAIAGKPSVKEGKGPWTFLSMCGRPMYITIPSSYEPGRSPFVVPFALVASAV